MPKREHKKPLYSLADEQGNLLCDEYLRLPALFATKKEAQGANWPGAVVVRVTVTYEVPDAD